MRYLLLALALVACGKPAAPKKYGSFVGPGFVHQDRDTLATLPNKAAGDTVQYDGTKWAATAAGSIPGALTLSGVQTDTSTGTQNNLVVNDTTAILRWSGASSVTYTGFKCGASDCTSADNGRQLIVEVAPGANLTATLADNNSGSTAANRIYTYSASNVALAPNDAGASANAAAELIYDGTSLRWRLVGYLSASLPFTTIAGINVGGPSITSGSGAPTGACTTGSLYMRTNGGTGSTLYVCESTAWVAK